MALYMYADNALREELIIPSSLIPVQHSLYIERFVAGSARLEIQGAYTDVVNRDYVVLITFVDETVGPTYRYDWSDEGGVTWNAVNQVVTANVWVALSHGVQIRFVQGTYVPQLVVGDRFRFHVERPYRPAFAIDGSRETELRSDAIGAGGIYTITFPFAVNTTPQALIIFDHNIPSNATILLQASTTSNFAVSPFNVSVPWAAGKILYRIPASTTYPYWRLRVVVVGAVSYIGMTGVYLGAEIAFTREFSIGFRKALTLMGGSEAATLVRGPGRYGLQPQRFELTFTRRHPGNDLTKFQTLWDLTHPTTKSQQPFYLYTDSVATYPIFELFHLEGDVPQQHEILDRFTPTLNLLQLVRTA